MERRARMKDALIAAALALVTLALAAGLLDRGHQQSDDFAAYMLQGKAIVEGRVQEQTELNEVLHPSRRDYGSDGGDGPLVYVWGLPMLLSVIFRLVGYDMPTGENIIWFKLPGVLMLSAAAAIAYIFFRRRFSRPVSAVLSAVLCMHCELLTESNYVQTDVPCMALSLLALLLIEVFLGQRRERTRVVTGVALGAAMWFTCEMRLNGKTVALVIALAHVIGLLREKPSGRAWLAHAVPWVTMAALWGVARIFLPAATSNTSHIAGGANWWIAYNIRAYDEELRRWVERMLPIGLPLAGYARFALYALAVLGVAAHGVRENLHLTALTVGTFAVLILLPYFQGLRYLFNILPLLLMFAAYGAGFLVGLLKKRPAVQRAARVLCGAVLAVMVLGTAQWTAQQERQHAEAGGTQLRYEAYSDELTDMFAYIYTQTQEDALIAFFKPRLLYLNTGRVGVVPGVGEHTFSEADYILLSSDPGLDCMRPGMWPELWAQMELVYDNGGYELYRLLPERQADAAQGAGA